MATMKPLGIWGLAGLSFVDAALIPLPTSMDGTVLIYVQGNHGRFVLYCLVAALASCIGSLVPYFVGRAGGELFLLKRINRQRYERMRDRFEKQEFLAIMIPAMLPPPTPIKLFEFAAGVFEMKPLPFATAIFLGKLVQFLVCSILFLTFGPALLREFRLGLHEHAAVMWTVAGVLLVGLTVWIMRKLFSGRSETEFPVEEDSVEVSKL
ncbi:SNARE associated Golgi protein-related protein [Terriglobus saanensis SP1PR4]|uniref:SNARE associated Golgi protein-related protein n=2 Tax=Terriglobus saanensis TaxID=870903 RepID=E8V0P3_TERSS|nr:SNARE associated Golgi protein-related protein [Terriglobus saanensis SP1PR4]